jgi:hypothetical protein
MIPMLAAARLPVALSPYPKEVLDFVFPQLFELSPGPQVLSALLSLQPLWLCPHSEFPSAQPSRLRAYGCLAAFSASSSGVRFIASRKWILEAVGSIRGQ